MAKQNKSRKFVAVSATAALVASAIVPVASAAVNDLDTVAPYAQEAVQYLVDNGVVQGDNNGNFDPKGTITRAQAATIFANYFKLEAGEENPFTDVKAGAWYTDAITGAYAAGLVNGLDETTFGPSKTLTRAEAATLLVRAFKLEGAADLSGFADAEGLAEWKTEALAVAVEEGVIEGIKKDGKLYLEADAPITREQFSTIFYRTLEANGLIGEEETKEAAIETFTATGVKELTVKFNQAVDTEKAEFAVTRGTSTNVVVEGIEWNEEKTVATLSLNTKLVEGKYTVSVTGVSEAALTSSVETTNEVATSIQFLSNALVLTGEKGSTTDTVKAVIAYEVLNQYGEDITDSINTSNLEVKLTGISDETQDLSTKGKIVFEIAKDEDEGAKGTLSLEYYKKGDYDVEASTEVVLSEESEAAAVTIAGIYNDENLALTTDNVKDTTNEYFVLFTAKDQYGLTIEATDANVEVVKDGIRVDVSNDDIFDLDEANVVVKTIEGKKYFAIPLEFASAKQEAGENTVSIKTRSNGEVVTAKYEMIASSAVQSITLAKPEMVAGGEEVKVEATVLDQYGDVVTDEIKLNKLVADGLVTVKRNKVSEGQFVEEDGNYTLYLQLILMILTKKSQHQLNLK